MPPKNPWGKKSQPPNTIPSAFSEFKPDNSYHLERQFPAHKSQYEEIQEDELIALASIYGDDFRTVESNYGAWKVTFPYIKSLL